MGTLVPKWEFSSKMIKDGRMSVTGEFTRDEFIQRCFNSLEARKSPEKFSDTTWCITGNCVVLVCRDGDTYRVYDCDIQREALCFSDTDVTP